MPERPGAEARRIVAERAQFLCEYCLTPAGLAPSPFSAEHILPRSRGGNDELENLAFACQGCNGHKAAKMTSIDPALQMSAGLFDPRRQLWDENFEWTADGAR